MLWEIDDSSETHPTSIMYVHICLGKYGGLLCLEQAFSMLFDVIKCHMSSFRSLVQSRQENGRKARQVRCVSNIIILFSSKSLFSHVGSVTTV